MIGGPGAGSSSSSSGGSVSDSGGAGGDNSGKVPSNDASRNNYCGSDWNDAVLNCDKDDHWCALGSDSDCLMGKVCFAGTVVVK